MREKTLRLGGVLVLVGLIVAAIPLMAIAHDDGGVDEPWVSEMNQETYWESRFGGEGLKVTCTKFNDHPGTGVGSYEAVVVHGGQKVRVYYPNTNDTVIGPQNTQGNNAGKDVHHDISWVMKCDIEKIPDDDPEDTTTTLTEETTTTTLDESTTTTFADTTTTTVEETTTTEGETTTTPVDDSTTTTEPTNPPSPPVLPFTGSDTDPWMGLAIGLVSVGGLLAMGSRFFKDDESDGELG
jgi:hypothetical protein